MTAIRVELELADGSFTTRMMRAGQTIRSFKNDVAAASPSLKNLSGSGEELVRVLGLADHHTKGFLSTLRDFAIVTGVVSVAIGKLSNIQSSWVGHIVRVNSEFERMIYQMRSMSTASDPVKEAAENVQFLRKAALDMPFRLETINNAFVKLKATGTDPLNGSLQALADGVAAFGGTDEALNRIVLGISQISGKGVIQMEELRQQLGEQMPTAVQVMARSMGISMSRLIDIISTGTLSAKESLHLFFQEIDRSYGGRARYMMQTFTGQVQRARTQLENLALVVGGMDEKGFYLEGGFMATLTQQLRDLNDVLGSKAGNAIAKDIGDMLSAAVRWLRVGIETVIEFREGVLDLGKAIAGAFVFHTALSGLTSLVQRLARARVELAKFGDTMASVARRMRYASMERQSGAGMLEAMAMRSRAAGTALKAVLGATAALAPEITILGLALYEGAKYFGLFENSVDKAWRKLVKFGEETRKQAQDIVNAKVAQLEQQAANLQRAMDGLRESMRAQGLSDELIEQTTEWKGYADELANIQKQLEEVRETGEKAIQEATERETDKFVDEKIAALDKLRRAEQSAYVSRQIEIQEEFDKRVQEAQRLNQSVESIEKERGKQLLAEAAKFHEAIIEDLKEAMAEAEDVVFGNDADSVTIDRHSALLDKLREMYLKELNLLHEVRNQIPGAPTIPSALNDEKRLEKGRQRLAQIKAEVAGLKAQLSGANAEVVELQEVLSNTNKYGHIDTSGVKELIDELVRAQAEKELLDELMEGKKKLKDDVEQNRLKLIEREMELREEAMGRELTGAEKIRMRIEQGFYSGFGPQSETSVWLRNIIRHIDAQGIALDNVANTARNNTFGPQTVQRIRTVNDELRNTAGIITEIGRGLTGLDFGRISMSGDRFLPGGSSATALGQILPSFEGANSLMETAARFVGMREDRDRNTLSQFFREANLNVDPKMTAWCAAFVNAVLATNGIKGTGSLAARSFLNWGQAVSNPQKGDIVILRRGNNPAKGHVGFLQGFDKNGNPIILGGNQDEGGPDGVNVKTFRKEDVLGYRRAPVAGSSADVPASVASSYKPMLDQLERELREEQERIFEELDRQEAQERQLQTQEKIQARNKAIEELRTQTKEADESLGTLSKHYDQIVKKIAAGKFGESRDPQADEYREVLQAAKELDEVEARRAERRKTFREIQRAEEDFAQRRIELAREAEEAHARMLDPLEKESTRAFRALESKLDEYVRDVEKFYGSDSEQYKRALDEKKLLLDQQRRTEAAEYFADLARKTQETKRSFLSQSEARRAAMQQELAEVDRWVARAREAGLSEVQITQQVEEAKAAIREKYRRQMNPMESMFQEWGDLQGNLAKQSVQWMNSLADGLTNLIMGTGDLRSVINGILKDMINIGIKYLMSQFQESKSSAGSKLGGGLRAGKGGKMSTGGKGKFFPIAHSGGIVGVSGLARKLAHPGVFMNAPRFHGGGIVGAPRLSADEVPIIARVGEGVFTPEQMKAMGGFGQQMIQINAPVTVNASGGTPEQNDDLARRTAKQMEATLRGIVADELMKATRPGNVLNRRAHA